MKYIYQLTIAEDNPENRAILSTIRDADFKGYQYDCYAMGDTRLKSIKQNINRSLKELIDKEKPAAD